MMRGRLARAAALAAAYPCLAWVSALLAPAVVEPVVWLPAGLAAGAVLLWGAAALPALVLGAILTALLRGQPLDWLAVVTEPAQAYALAALYARLAGRGALALPGMREPVRDPASASARLLLAAALGTCLAPAAAAAARLAWGEALPAVLSVGRVDWAAHLLGSILAGAPVYHFADRWRGGAGLLSALSPTGLCIAALGIPAYLLHSLGEAGYFGPQTSLVVQESVSLALFAALNGAGLLTVAAGSYIGTIRRRSRRERLVTDNARDYVTLYQIAAGRARLVFSSPSYHRLLESEGWRGAARIHGDDFARVRAAFHAVAASARPARYEFRLAAGAAGLVRWIETEASVVSEPSSSARHVLCVSRDVTDRRLAEDRLRDSDERFRAMTALSSDWYWEQDENLRFTLLTKHWGADWGHLPLRPDTVLGHRRWEIEGLSPLSEGWDQHRATLQARLPFREFEFVRHLADGAGQYVSTSGEPVLRADGSFAGYRGIASDITDRKRVELELDASRRRYRDMYENAPVGIAILQDGRPQFQNPAAERILGGTPQDELGRLFLEFAALAPEGVQDGRGPSQAEFEAPLAGGRRWLDAVSSRIDWNGRPGAMVFFRDVTAQKESERQMQELQRMETIGQLTGGLSHDFNNLLGVVVGNLDLLGERLPADPAMQRQHRAALDAALRGVEVTRALLGVARRQPLEVKVHDLNALLAEMDPLLRSSAGAAVSLSMELCEGVLEAPLDASGLSNVVLNIVLNARDAMRASEGERRLALRTRHEGAHAVIEIADNGCGMSETVLAHAFEPFFTTKERGKGTGLGLAMVRSYAEQLGGDAAIDSAAGKGTTVIVRLPCARPGRAGAAQAGAAVDGPAPPGRTLRVLVVDDEASLRELACTWLAALGHAPVSAPSPAEALARLGEGFDLLFTDIVMPGPMDGIALAREAQARHPHLRVLFTSGYARTLIDNPHPLGGPLLKKPYRLRDLAQALAATRP